MRISPFLSSSTTTAPNYRLYFSATAFQHQDTFWSATDFTFTSDLRFSVFSRVDMLTLTTVFAVTAALVFPVMASDPIRVHKLPPYIEPRGVLQTRDVQQTPTLVLSQSPNTKYPIDTIGIVGEPLVLSQSPSPTPRGRSWRPNRPGRTIPPRRR